MNWYDPVETQADWRWRLGAVDLQAHLFDGVMEISTQELPEQQEAQVGGRQDPFPKAVRVAVSAGSTLRLRPRHADRPVVGRPEQPLTLMPGVSLQVYINVPAWLSLEMQGKALWEGPSVTPGDTCFGSPVEGSLAYAIRTHLRTDPSKFQPSPHRIRVPVMLHNQSPEPLPVKRLRVPVQELAVYASAEGTLWSQEVVFTRSAAPEDALVEVSASPPKQALPEQVSPPRSPGVGGPRVLQAFNAFFSGVS